MQQQKLTVEPVKKETSSFRIGDTVKVYQTVIEGENKRTQIFEGIVIAKKGSGLKETFTVRKISYGIGVERTYPLHSPLIVKIEVVKSSKVRKAKLYYLREKIGKEALLKDKKSFFVAEKKEE